MTRSIAACVLTVFALVTAARADKVETKYLVQVQLPTLEAARELSLAGFDVAGVNRKAMLAEGHWTPDAPVFCGTRSGSWMRKSDVYRLSFQPILKRAGLKFRFHDLRHASATLLLADGVDVKTVQSRLGHSAAAVTMDIYAHALDRGQQTAAASMQALLGPKSKEKSAGAG